MESLSNLRLSGNHHRPILTDIVYKPTQRAKPLVIFVHGFKGFKDWGHFNLLARLFAEAGFVFAKFNFSHNGTTPERPTEFVDTEAFANNNFSIELDDLGTIIDVLTGDTPPIPKEEIDSEQVYLIGHSRGGGIAILKAREDRRVKKIVTWASVSEFGKFWSQSVIKQWREKGVWHVLNTRTGEQLPMYWQLYENYSDNLNRLHIPTAMEQLKIPTLIIHGTADEAVPTSAATALCMANPIYTQLLLIERGNHVFGASHPFTAEQLPPHSEQVWQATLQHFS